MDKYFAGKNTLQANTDKAFLLLVLDMSDTCEASRYWQLQLLGAGKQQGHVKMTVSPLGMMVCRPLLFQSDVATCVPGSPWREASRQMTGAEQHTLGHLANQWPAFYMHKSAICLCTFVLFFRQPKLVN